MTDMERRTFCAALSRYGAQAQITMAFEEMAAVPAPIILFLYIINPKIILFGGLSLWRALQFFIPTLILRVNLNLYFVCVCL
uniref:Uncharacterized protein n=1 Tax=Siphoviridae sp. ctwfx1 TaxID=2825732 RepID=A0A8S5UVB7_9CAUD|nr:MAG TPA: hypothetical protein [Siphoviridae sp. ctwfx1]